MIAEVYSKGNSRRSLSARQISQLKKKALQSYSHISKIKQKSDKEATYREKEADTILDKFITSSDKNGK